MILSRFFESKTIAVVVAMFVSLCLRDMPFDALFFGLYCQLWI